MKKWSECISSILLSLVFLSLTMFLCQRGYANDVGHEKETVFDEKCNADEIPAECIFSSDKKLSSLRDQVHLAYKQRLHTLSGIEREFLETDQAHWESTTDPDCSITATQLLKRDRLPSTKDCLEDRYNDRVAALKQKCEIDETHTLNDMLALPKSGLSKVPLGLNVDNKLGAYITIRNTRGYQFPSFIAPSTYGLSMRQGGVRLLALCRVQGLNGEWWLVSRNKGGDLSYVPEADTKKAEDRVIKQETKKQN